MIGGRLPAYSLGYQLNTLLSNSWSFWLLSPWPSIRPRWRTKKPSCPTAMGHHATPSLSRGWVTWCVCQNLTRKRPAMWEPWPALTESSPTPGMMNPWWVGVALWGGWGDVRRGDTIGGVYTKLQWQAACVCVCARACSHMDTQCRERRGKCVVGGGGGWRGAAGGSREELTLCWLWCDSVLQRSSTLLLWCPCVLQWSSTLLHLMSLCFAVIFHIATLMSLCFCCDLPHCYFDVPVFLLWSSTLLLWCHCVLQWSSTLLLWCPIGKETPTALLKSCTLAMTTSPSSTTTVGRTSSWVHCR